MGKWRRITMVVMSLILFYLGWAIFWNAVGPQIKWVETVSVENTLHLLDRLEEQGLLIDSVDKDLKWNFALSPARDRLKSDIGDAYRTSMGHAFFVMTVSLIVLLLCCIPNQKSVSRE